MKKLLIVLLLFILSSCDKPSWKDTPYQKHEAGTIVIDSAKFKPVLMYAPETDKVIIADEVGVKTIYFFPVHQVLVMVLMALVLGIFVGYSVFHE